MSHPHKIVLKNLEYQQQQRQHGQGQRHRDRCPQRSPATQNVLSRMTSPNTDHIQRCNRRHQGKPHRQHESRGCHQRDQRRSPSPQVYPITKPAVSLTARFVLMGARNSAASA